MLPHASLTSGASADPSEAALVDGLRRGEDQSYARLVGQYGPAMLSRARYLLQNDDDAHDAVQLALLAVFRHIASFERRAKLSTWLHSIVSNAALTIRRQRSRRVRREQPLVEAARVEAPPERGPERQLIDEQRRRMLASALDRLGPGYRAVLDSSLAGQSSRDSASRLSISRSAFKSRRFRAFRMLRDQMVARVGPHASSSAG